MSFISLRKVLPAVARRLEPATEGVLLVKPQFEAGPADVPRGGVIRDEAVRDRVVASVFEWLRGEGWVVLASMRCPVAGGEGNVEELAHVRTPGAPRC